MGDRVERQRAMIKECRESLALPESISALKNSFHVVMVGLEGSGKSTILYRLKYGQYISMASTIGFNCEKVIDCFQISLVCENMGLGCLQRKGMNEERG